MADLFERTEVNFGGSMHSQFGLLVPSGGLTGVLMQNLQIAYSQNVSRIYEIGRAGLPTNIYYIGGRANGQLSAGHVIGPGSTMLAFYRQFSDVCQAGTNLLSLKIGPNVCGTAKPVAAALGVSPPAPAAAVPVNLTYTAKYCVLVNIGMGVAAQDFVINETSALTFSGLELK